jgi:hypothetical protein
MSLQEFSGPAIYNSILSVLFLIWYFCHSGFSLYCFVNAIEDKGRRPRLSGSKLKALQNDEQ